MPKVLADVTDPEELARLLRETFGFTDTDSEPLCQIAAPEPFASVTDPEELASLLRETFGFKGTAVVPLRQIATAIVKSEQAASREHVEPPVEGEPNETHMPQGHRRS